MPKISINLVTWNGEKYIEACLASVFNQTFQDFSIIIIDNGSTDNTLGLINERYPHLQVVRNKSNAGFAKAHNQAMHWTKSEYVLCLNQDVILAPDYARKVIGLMDSHPQVGAVSGKILRMKDDAQPDMIDSAGLLARKNLKVEDLGSGEVDQGQYDDTREVFGVSGAVPVYRRSALEKVMYQNEFFDESFFSYKEDVDLAFRLRRAGFSAWRVGEAVAYHDRTVGTPIGNRLTSQMIKARKDRSAFNKYLSYRNHLYFLFKNAKFSWRVFLYELMKFLYILIFEKGAIKAWSEFFKHRKSLSAKRAVMNKTATVDYHQLQKLFK